MLPARQPRFTIAFQPEPAIVDRPLGPVLVENARNKNLYVLTHGALIVDRVYRLLRLLLVLIVTWLVHDGIIQTSKAKPVKESAQLQNIAGRKR